MTEMAYKDLKDLRSLCLKESFKNFTFLKKEEHEILTLPPLDKIHTFMKNTSSIVANPCEEENTILLTILLVFLDRPMVSEESVGCDEIKTPALCLHNKAHEKRS